MKLFRAQRHIAQAAAEFNRQSQEMAAHVGALGRSLEIFAADDRRLAEQLRPIAAANGVREVIEKRQRLLREHGRRLAELADGYLQLGRTA